MSLHHPEQPPTTPNEQKEASFETKIASMRQKFYFHQLIKESDINKHYIIEDISNLAEQTSPVFYYLKQTKYRSQEEHLFAKKFYARFSQYCHSPFAKNDITKLKFLYQFEDEARNYYELITIFEYGDSDRIDTDMIEPEQILRFMRNVCFLLEEVQKHCNIAHGNISLKNMVLTNNELKLSGFKPILQTKESRYHSWKVDLAREYGAMRLDLYLIGLMWMNFAGVNISRINSPSYSLDKVLKLSLEAARSLSHLPSADLLIKLIDVFNNPIVTLDHTITELDEYFMMEEIKAKKATSKNDIKEKRGEQIGSTSFSHANFNNGGDTIGKISNQYDSNDENKQKKSESKLSNPFTRAYKDSDYDVHNRQEGDRRGTRDNQSLSLKGKNGEFLIYGGEYSLRPKESFGDLPSLHRNKTEGESFSDLNFDTDNFLNNLNPKNSPNHNGKPEDKFNSHDPGKLSLQRNMTTDNNDEDRKISFDDLGNGKRISFRNPNLTNLETNLRESLYNNLKRESHKNNDLFQNSQYARFNSRRQDEFKDDESDKHRQISFDDPRIPKASLQNNSNRPSLQKKDTGTKESKANLLERTSNKNSIAQLKDKPNERESLKKLTDKIQERESHKKPNERQSLHKPSLSSNFPKEVDPLSNRKSTKKSEAEPKQSVPSQSSLLGNEIHAKLFGNKNSITNQILNGKSGLKDSEYFDNPQADPKSVFNKKDSVYKNEGYAEHPEPHKNSITNKHSTTDKQPKLAHDSIRDLQVSHPARSDSKAHDSNKRSLTPSKNSNVRYSEHDSRKGSLNHRLVEEALSRNSRIYNKEALYDSDGHALTDSKHKSDSIVNENKNEIYTYDKTDDFPNLPSAIHMNHNPSIKKLELNNSFARESDIPKSNSHPIPYVNENSKKLKEDLFASGLNDNVKPFETYGNNQQTYGSHNHHQLVLDPKLLRPSKSIGKKLKDTQQDDKRTFSNLDPKTVEKSPLKRIRNDESSKDQQDNSPMDAIRNKIRDALKVELPESKKLEIIEKVQKEHEEELRKKFYRSWKQREKMIEKTETQRLLAHELDSKIKEISEKRLKYKKEKGSSSYKKQQAVDRVMNIDNLEKEHAPIKQLTKELEKDNLHFNTYHNSRSSERQFKDLNSHDIKGESLYGTSSKSPSRFKKKNDFEDVNQNANRNFKLSPIQKRDKLFAYNHDHEVLKIPFRKVIENFQAPPNNQASDHKNQLHYSTSHPHFHSAFGFKSLQNVVPKQNSASVKLLHDQNDGLQNYFFKNQPKDDLKEKLDDIAIFNTLKSVKSPLPGTNQETPNAIRNSLAGSLADNSHLLDQDHFPQNPVNQEDFVHMNDKPDILVQEIQNYTIFTPHNAFELPSEIKKSSPELDADVQKIKRCFMEQRVQDSHIHADMGFKKYTGTNQVEILKIKAFLHFSSGNISKAKETLLEAMQLLKQKIGLNQTELYFAFIVINLAFLEFYCQDYEEAIRILKHSIFANAGFRPFFYNNFLAACHYFLSKFSSARQFYSDQLKMDLSRENIDQSAISTIFGSISKILCCFVCENEKVEAARFFQSLEEPFKRLVTYSKGFNPDEHPYLKNLFEKLIFIFLKFGYENSNGGLLNFVLQRSLEKKIIDPLTNFKEEEKTQFCNYILYICNYLKSKPNYGNFQTNYSRYLDLGKKIISTCNLNMDNLKINLNILFQKGIYCLNNNEEDKAKILFDKCFKLYSTYFDGKNPELLDMFLKIGTTTVKQKRYEHAAFFFEKILTLNCPSQETHDEAQRQLGKAYFRLQRYEDCVAFLKSYIETVVFKHDALSFGKSLFKEICMFFVANEKARLNEFGQIREILVRKLLFSPKIFIIRYIELFNILSSNKFSNQSQEARQVIMRNLRKVLDDVKKEDEDSLLRLVAFATTAYTSILDESQIEPEEKGLPLLQLLKDKDLTVAENAKIIHQFIFNFVFMINELISGGKPNQKEDESKVKELDGLLLIRSFKNSEEVIIDLIKNTGSTSIESQAFKIQKILKNTYESKAKEVNPDLNKPSNSDDFQLPPEMKNMIEAYDLDKEFCKCSQVDEETYSVTTLIEQFLKHVKNMLFLEIYEHLEEYYKKFEAIIAEKNWNWNKFEYVRALFNYYLQYNNERLVEKVSFVQLLDSIFENPDLCIHDLKLIVLLIESFKNIQYMEIFVRYIDRFHPTMAAVVFNIVFMKNFNAKCSYVASSFYKKIYNYQFYQLENFPLMHVIGIENFLLIEKELDFKVYVRRRYDCMANPKYFEIFSSYIAPKVLRQYYLQYAFYNTIVLLIKRQSEHHSTILQAFQNQLAACHNHLPLNKADNLHYFYDLYLIVNLIDFMEMPSAVDLIIQILQFLEDKLSQNQIFHFAVLCSFTGNFFCKFKFFDASIKTKYMALNALKRLTPGPVIFPSYMVEIDLKSLVFGVLSFLVIDNLELKQIDESDVFLAKLFEYHFENGTLDLEKLLVNFWFEYKTEAYKQSVGTLELAQKLYEKMQLNDFLTKMFKATLDKMQYLVSRKVENKEKAKRKKEIADESIAKLIQIKP